MKNYIFAGTDPSPSATEKNNAALARNIADEGIVLLKNEGILPIRRQKIALFGFGARMTVKGGTGSGAVNERHSISIEEGLQDAGYIVTTGEWLSRCKQNYDSLYQAWREAREKEIAGMTDIMQILATVAKTPFIYPTGVAVTKEDIATSDTDVAIYVLARQAGEGDDRSLRGGDYRLDEMEIENLRCIAANFKDTVLVINAGGPIDLSEVENLGIKAIVYYGQAGQEGGRAFADIVSGKISPSGKLTATWAKRYEDIPGGKNYGALGNVFEQDYEEDIYVGYRYYDTFGTEPLYPFGFGLSYTDFEISGISVVQNRDELRVRGEVRNAGSREGKEVVQVYVSVPFGKDGAEYQRLVGFYKTKLLCAAESCAFDIRIPVDELTRYDERRAAFLLASGEYVVRVGNSSRNTVPVCRIEVKEETVLEQCVNICPLQKEYARLLAPARKTENLSGVRELLLRTDKLQNVTHSYGEKDVCVSKAAKAIVKKMPVEDLGKLVIGGGTVGERIVEVFGSSGTTTCGLYEKYGIPNAVMADGPAGLNLGNKFSVSDAGKMMALAVPPAYDFGIFGQYIRETIAKEAIGGIIHYQYATAWPSGHNLAQTWNLALAHRFGAGIAKEMKSFGVSVWLAPGMNIQRNPLCGRNFEYYSEDPLLSGCFAAEVVESVQNSGKTAVSVKHFCCNNMERERSYSSSNLSERALREIYLKGFKRAIKKQPLTVMSSYNKINGVYSPNNADLLIKVLRCEWGFNGLVMTDWSSCAADKASVTEALRCENDLIMPGSPEEEAAVVSAVREGTLSEAALRKSAARVLELISRTAAIPFKKE